jgi:outer membrane protein assembly factor BamB
LSAQDGSVLWRRGVVVGGEKWTVVADNERVYLSDPNLQSEIAWTALDVRNGRTLWRMSNAQTRPRASLAPLGGVLVETAEGLPLVRFLDPASGKMVWQSEDIVKWFPQGPVLESTNDGAIVGRELATGKVLWTLAASDDLVLDATGAVAGGSDTLYVPLDGVGALSGADTPGALSASLRNGQVTWRHIAQDTPYAQDLQTMGVAGDVLLMQRSSRIARPKLSGRVEDGSVRSLVALDARQGDVAWGFWDLEATPEAPPLRIGSSLWVVGQDKDGHTVYCFDLDKIKSLVQAGRRWWW